MNKAKRISIILSVSLLLGLVYYFAVEYEYFSPQKISLPKSEKIILLDEVTKQPLPDYCNAEIRNLADGKVLAVSARDTLSVSILGKERDIFSLDGSFSQGNIFNKVMISNYSITADDSSKDNFLLELTASKNSTAKCGEYVCSSGDGVLSVWKVDDVYNKKVLASNQYSVSIEQKCSDFGNKKHGYDIFAASKGEGIFIILQLILQFFGGGLH